MHICSSASTHASNLWRLWHWWSCTKLSMKCATSLLQFPLMSGDKREYMAVRHGRRTSLYVFRTAETQTGGRHLLELRKTAPDQLPACQRKCCCPCTKCVLAHLPDHPGHLVDEVSSHHLWFDCRVSLLCALSQHLSSEHGRSAADVGCAADGDSAIHTWLQVQTTP